MSLRWPGVFCVLLAEAAFRKVNQELVPALNRRFAPYAPLLEIFRFALHGQWALRDEEARFLSPAMAWWKKKRLGAVSTDMAAVIGW